MNKRTFLGLFLVPFGEFALKTSQDGADSKAWSAMTDDAVTFEWRHTAGYLECRLSAPTAGWIAAGFNEHAGLRDTRFVIASVSGPHIVADEHLAIVPAHKPVQSLGLHPALYSISGAYTDGVSHITFSMAEEIPGRPNLQLGRGSLIYLMLAWSQSSDFEHHSAWRRHYAM